MNKEARAYMCVCMCAHTHTYKWGNPTMYDNIDGPWLHYDKWNKLDKDKYYIISPICGI